MKQIVTFLKQLDLSTTEIKIYLKLLSSGAMTVSELAEKIKINRTAIYTHIYSLLEKGIITNIKGITTKVEACPPEHIYTLVDYKKQKIQSMEHSLPNVVNTLNNLIPKRSSVSKDEIKYYKGLHGIASLYKKILKTNELRSYVDYDTVIKTLPENDKIFYNAFHNNTSLKMFEIIQDTNASRNKKYNFLIKNSNHPRFKYKFLPKNIVLEASDTIIFDEKVAIINIKDRNNLSAVLLSNQDYYKNSVQLFDLLWKLLPEIEPTK